VHQPQRQTLTNAHGDSDSKDDSLHRIGTSPQVLVPDCRQAATSRPYLPAETLNCIHRSRMQDRHATVERPLPPLRAP
jgi:hypothetical protein